VRLKTDEMPPLTLEQVAAYLRENHRNAESLLGAFHATRDQALLAEAKEKFPDDPHVAFAAAFQGSASPEERRKWLDVLKRVAPDNAMADYLSAFDHFSSAQTDLALQEVMAAANKPLRSYDLDFVQNDQEAYRAVGYTEAEARTIASRNLLLPELSPYKKVGVNLVDLAKAYQQNGDTASAQASLQLAMDLGQRLDESGTQTFIQKLVGMAIQKLALNTMDPNATLAGGQTVQARLDGLQQEKAYINSLDIQWQNLAPNMSDQDVMNYYDRQWRFGVIQAHEWMINKFGTPATIR
jgi:hypothetical protein